MQHQNIKFVDSKLSDSKFVTRNWNVFPLTTIRLSHGQLLVILKGLASQT